MTITTEQEILDSFYPDDNTKTMSDVVTEFKILFHTESKSISSIKLLFKDVSEWTI